MTKTLLFSLVFLLACTEQKKAQLPGTADKHLPQIYFLFDASSSPLERLEEVPDGAIEADFAARVEQGRVKNIDEAKEKLQQWNGRPVDLLVLGPGLPEKAFGELKLSKNAKQLLHWGLKEAPKEGTAVYVDWKSVGPFLKMYCARAFSKSKGCHLGPEELEKDLLVSRGQNLVLFGSQSAAVQAIDALRISIRWPDLFRYLLREGEAGLVPKVLKLDFKSGFLYFSAAPFPQGSEDRKDFDALLKSWSLENL